MDTVTFLPFILVICIESTDASDSCQFKLTFEIEQCLQKYEAKYIVYSELDSSSRLKKAMQPMLCRDYESSLQCLHFALKACPATDFHLQMIGSRLGHVRLFMAKLCEHFKQQTTAITTTIPIQEIIDLSGEEEDYSSSNIDAYRKQDIVTSIVQKKTNLLKTISIKGFQNELHKQLTNKNKSVGKTETSEFQSLQQQNDCSTKDSSKCSTTNKATAPYIIDSMVFIGGLCLYTWL